MTDCVCFPHLVRPPFENPQLNFYSFKIIGWRIRPVKAEDNDGVDVMFDVHFERFGNTDFDEVLRHPLAEEVDDYKAYKRCCREQRDAEKHGTLHVGSLNYRAASEMNLNERDFQEQFRHPSAKAKEPQPDYVLPLQEEESKISRKSSLHGEEVIDFAGRTRNYDGSTEDAPRFHKVEWNPSSRRNL